MAGKKILGSNGLRHLRNSYVRNDGVPKQEQLDASITHAEIKEPSTYGTYKMKDLYPDTYKTMTAVPSNLDVSTLRVVDGLFEGCAALESVDGLDISSAVSANHLFDGCTALKSVKGIVSPKCESWEYAFQDCTSLSELEEWAMPSATDFYAMFCGCSSLPETFPFTLDLSRAQQPNTKYTGLIFEASSVKNVTIKQDWKLNFTIHDFISTNDSSSSSPAKNYDRAFIFIIGMYFKEYLRHNNVDTSASSLTLPYAIGNGTYTVTLPEPSDWMNESYFDKMRKNWMLFFSRHISGQNLSVYTLNMTETPILVYDESTGTTKESGATSKGYTPKTYDEDPTNYLDVIDYDVAVDRTAKTIVFAKKTDHILKPALNITWA